MESNKPTRAEIESKIENLEDTLRDRGSLRARFSRSEIAAMEDELENLRDMLADAE